MTTDKHNQATCTRCKDAFELPDPPRPLEQTGLCPDCEDTMATGGNDGRDFSAAE